MKKVLLYILCALAVFFAFFFICEIPFFNSARNCESKKKKMISEISENSHLKKISCIEQIKDFDPIFNLYLEMDGDVKIILKNVFYEGENLVFERIPRFGNFCFMSCEYDVLKKRFYSFDFDIYNEFDDVYYKIGESPFYTKNVLDILNNYDCILDELNSFQIVDEVFLDMLKEGRDEDAFNVFNGKKTDTVLGRKKIRCMYIYLDKYEKTFFGSPVVWKDLN